MATTGEVTIDLNNFRDIVNNSATAADQISGGIATQGSLIGTVIGIVIAVSLLIALIVLVFGIIYTVIRMAKGVKKA